MTPPDPVPPTAFTAEQLREMGVLTHKEADRLWAEGKANEHINLRTSQRLKARATGLHAAGAGLTYAAGVLEERELMKAQINNNAAVAVMENEAAIQLREQVATLQAEQARLTRELVEACELRDHFEREWNAMIPHAREQTARTDAAEERAEKAEADQARLTQALKDALDAGAHAMGVIAQMEVWLAEKIRLERRLAYMGDNQAVTDALEELERLKADVASTPESRPPRDSDQL